MKRTIAFSLLLASSVVCQAATITILNPGFEATNIGSGNIVNGVATSWNVSNGNAGTWNPGPGSPYFNGNVPEGSQILFAGFGASGDANQTLAATVAANTTYTLSYSIGQRLDMPLGIYSVALLANGTSLLTSDIGGAATTPGNFVARSITFTSGAAPATLGQTLGIYIHSAGIDSSFAAAQAEFDNFSLTANPTSSSGTPEPATFGMITAGIGAMSLARRRLQSKN